MRRGNRSKRFICRHFTAGAAHVELIEPRQLLAAHIAGSSTAYATIQAAVNAASAGATITVDAGTYAEKVVISKSLTLQGAQAGVDAPGRVNGGGSESVVSGAVSSGVHSCGFYVTASNVTIDGFTVQGETDSSDTLGAGIVIAPKVSGTHVFNNVIQNNVAGLFLANYSSTNPALIQHNYFANNNNAGGNSGRGIYTSGTISGGNLTNVTIDTNTFVNNYGTDKVEAACSFEASASGAQSNVQITNNVMSGNGKAALFFNTTGVTVTGNTITGCIDSGSAALRFEGNNHNVTIQHNTVHDNTAPAVAIDAKGTPGDSSSFAINYNNFYRNNTQFGPAASVVYSPSVYSGTLDVRYNWWGSSSGPAGDGPGTGDAVSAASLQTSPVEKWILKSGGSENYSGWLTSPYSSTPTLPTAPNGLSSIQPAAGQIALSWTDTAVGNENGFFIERSANGSAFTQIATTSAGVTRYTDSAGLSVGTTYAYRVAAFNNLGQSGYSNVSQTTLASSVTAYLSDLPWVSATTGYGTIGIDKTVGGRTITLRGTTYAKGIGTHAVSQIVYNLNGQYTTFSSDVGVDDEENGKGIGSVDFQVIGDGVVLFDSGVVTNNSAVVHINVSVAGVKQLTLLATNGVAGSIDYDHADWAGAKLVSISSQPATPTVPTAPGSLTASTSPSAVVLNWVNTAAGNENGFVIQRSADGTTFASIGTVATGVTTYSDTDALTAGATYSYRVLAVNDVGTSDPSNVVSTTIPSPTQAARFIFTAVPTSAVAGSPITMTLTVLDSNGNVATGYVGTVHFTSSDANGLLPADYTFTADDAGSHTFAATLTKAGSQTVSVVDTASPTLAVASAPISVTAGSATRAVLSMPSSAKVKSTVTFVVTFYDLYGNVATGYLGTLLFSSSDRSALLPASYTFTAADQGTKAFKVTFKTRGTQSMTVTDKSNSSLTASSSIKVS
ncbi:MAG: NPCBM/NEW2 domain-containing protein [Tepidisphaeraceae bacterium]